MKKIILSIAMISSLGLIADDHLPENFSKYQSNFLFSCPMPNACLAAFDEYMNSPEVKSQNYEVDVYAVLHNGWDDATHGVSWYYKMLMNMLNLILYLQLRMQVKSLEQN